MRRSVVDRSRATWRDRGQRTLLAPRLPFAQVHPRFRPIGGLPATARADLAVVVPE
ncbi:MAG: hypothetical protein AAGB93_08120 [Planctomycetota bacterium]